MQFKLIAKTMAIVVVLCELVFARSGQEWYDYVQSHHKTRTEQITRDMGAIIGNLNKDMLQISKREAIVYKWQHDYINSNLSVKEWFKKTTSPTGLFALKRRVCFFNATILGKGIHNKMPVEVKRYLTITSFTGETGSYRVQNFGDALTIYQKLNQERFGLLFVEELLNFLQRHSRENISDDAMKAFLLGDEEMMNRAFVGKDDILKDVQALIRNRINHQQGIENEEFYVQSGDINTISKMRGKTPRSKDHAQKIQMKPFEDEWRENKEMKRIERINGKKLRQLKETKKNKRQRQKYERRGSFLYKKTPAA